MAARQVPNGPSPDDPTTMTPSVTRHTGYGGVAMNAEPARTAPAPPHSPSLARLFREYGHKWEIERVERGTEWVAVQRESGGDYIRIVGGRDLGALRYKMDQAERDEPEERGP
jgi:hypothetical protein